MSNDNDTEVGKSTMISRVSPWVRVAFVAALAGFGTLFVLFLLGALLRLLSNAFLSGWNL